MMRSSRSHLNRRMLMVAAITSVLRLARTSVNLYSRSHV
jgi:hypothetical protein